MTKRTNRRAVSTILGSAIFLVLFVAGFTVFIFALEVTGDRFSEQLSASFAESIRAKESFTIAPSVDTSDELFIELFNTGSVPVNALHAYVVNQSDGSILNYDINFQDGHVAPNERRALLANYVEGAGIDSKLNIPKPFTYDVKVVSEVGTTAIRELAVPLAPFEVDLFTIPKNLGTGQDVTIAMIVSNIGDNFIDNVTPIDTGDGMTTPGTAIQGTTDGPFPSPGRTLQPQESVIFTWQQTIIGAVGTTVSYTNGVTGTDPASGDTVTSATDTDSVEFVPQAISLLQRPDIGFLIPSPSGETVAAEDALWGINVINPTEVPIKVSRVIITASANSAAVKIFQSGTCGSVRIFPSSGIFTCPADNVLMWENIAAPVTVPARNTLAFIVSTDTADISVTDDPATLISATVYTTFGPSSELGLATGAINSGGGDGSLVSIFMTNCFTTACIITSSELDTSSVIGNLTGVASGSSFTLNITLGSFSTFDDSHIKSGTFIVNIPPGFTVGTLVDEDNFFPTCVADPTGCLQKTTYTDGSKQITGTFVNLGEDPNDSSKAIAEKLTVRVPLTAPNVTADSLYIVFALAEGIADGTSTNHPIGPIVEFPIQILELT